MCYKFYVRGCVLLFFHCSLVNWDVADDNDDDWDNGDEDCYDVNIGWGGNLDNEDGDDLNTVCNDSQPGKSRS